MKVPQGDVGVPHAVTKRASRAMAEFPVSQRVRQGRENRPGDPSGRWAADVESSLCSSMMLEVLLLGVEVAVSGNIGKESSTNRPRTTEKELNGGLGESEAGS